MIRSHRWRLLGGLLALLLLVGCGLVEPAATETPAVIFVTATPPPTFTPDVLALAPSPVIATVVLTPRLPTNTPTPLPTNPPSLTPSFTPTYTESPTPTGGAQQGPAGGGGLVTGGGNTGCTGTAQGGFATIYGRDAALQATIGCAIGGAVPVQGAIQQFEKGWMIWSSALGEIPSGVIYAAGGSSIYVQTVDSWREGVDPIDYNAGAPPAGRLAPIRGFGKVWVSSQTVRDSLGWALAGEQGTSIVIQRFQRGEMVFVGAVGQTFVFFNGNWRIEGTPF
jgi:hypothetical protein